MEKFNFEEFGETPDHEKLLWANSVFLTSLMIGESVSKKRLEADLRSGMSYRRLPTYVWGPKSDQTIQPCGEYLLTERAAKRIADLGIIPIRSVRDSAEVQVGCVLSISGSSLPIRR